MRLVSLLQKSINLYFLRNELFEMKIDDYSFMLLA